MKKSAIILLVFSLLFLVFAEDGNKKSIGKISFPLGRSYVKPNGDNQWVPAKYNMVVYNKDVIKTKKESRCEIKFSNKKVMRIGENTIIELKDNQSGKGEDVSISKGKAWISMFLPKGKSHLNVRTPSSVCGIRGTVYRLNTDDVKTQYRCYKGSLAITPIDESGKLSNKTIDVNAGEELILVMNFEEYMKQQKEAFDKSIQDDQKAMEEMMKQDMEEMNKMNQEFEDFKKQDAQDFSDFVKTGNLRIKKDKFDEKEETNSDWVQWNKERDAMINH